MKNPNGYGGVCKLSGKRRKPYAARITTGWDDQGKQIRLVLGTYKTRQEAMQALAAYMDNPYDLEMSKVSFEKIYERWFKETFDDESNASTVRNYKTAFKHCTDLHKMKMTDIRPTHMQRILDECPGGYQTVNRVYTLFNKLYDWCIRHDCIKKNYAKMLTVNVKSTTQKQRSPFSTQEIKILWNNASDENPYVAFVLMLIYCGVRISELLDLEKKHVHLDEQYFWVVDSKTEAGIRIVPIADKVLPFWKMFMDMSKCEYAVCNINGQKLTYDNFKRRYWFPLMERLGMQHVPHETRHTCISQLTMKNANETIIKKIVGHKSVMNLTEKVYTHIEISELINTINLI